MKKFPPGVFDRLEEVVAPIARPERPPKAQIGKYRLIAEIAQGAMGVVHEAEDMELRRRVAIKLLRDAPGARANIRHRFQREALAAAQLSHPNVVRVYDSGEDEGQMYLVMELVAGHSLREVMEEKPRDLRRLLALLEKTARGTAAAHAAGVVHRDLKPANILVTPEGEPKVGDFGLAHWMESDTDLTKTGTPLGTPAYMAPEQVRGQHDLISPATDVYALGAILYEMLAGRPPHQGDSAMELYSRIVGEEPVRPKRINARIHSDIETICLKALDKEPSRRYPSAKEFADDLKRYLDGESIQARPPGPLTVSVKWARRHRTITGIALVTLLASALLAVSLTALVRKRREADEAKHQVEVRDKFDVLMKSAARKRNAGDAKGALDDCSKVIEMMPDDARAYNERAVARKMLRDYPGMIEDCTTAIRLDPKSEAAYVNRAYGWQLKGDRGRAIDDYTAAINLGSVNSRVWSCRASLRMELKDGDGALADCEQALALDPKDYLAFAVRGRIRINRKMTAEGRADLEEALRLAPLDWAERSYIEQGLKMLERQEKEKSY